MFFLSLPAFLKQYYCKKSNLDFKLSGSYWPTILTIKRIEKNPSLLKKVLRWIEELQEAKEVRRMFLLSGDGTADIVAFEACINSVRKCWYVLTTALHEHYYVTHVCSVLTFHYSRINIDTYIYIDIYNCRAIKTTFFIIFFHSVYLSIFHSFFIFSTLYFSF